jgi:hypothetical protein
MSWLTDHHSAALVDAEAVAEVGLSLEGPETRYAVRFIMTPWQCSRCASLSVASLVPLPAHLRLGSPARAPPLRAHPLPPTDAADLVHTFMDTFSCTFSCTLLYSHG